MWHQSSQRLGQVPMISHSVPLLPRRHLMWYPLGLLLFTSTSTFLVHAGLPQFTSGLPLDLEILSSDRHRVGPLHPFQTAPSTITIIRITMIITKNREKTKNVVSTCPAGPAQFPRITHKINIDTTIIMVICIQRKMNLELTIIDVMKAPVTWDTTNTTAIPHLTTIVWDKRKIITNLTTTRNTTMLTVTHNTKNIMGLAWKDILTSTPTTLTSTATTVKVRIMCITSRTCTRNEQSHP